MALDLYHLTATTVTGPVGTIPSRIAPGVRFSSVTPPEFTSRSPRKNRNLLAPACTGKRYCHKHSRMSGSMHGTTSELLHTASPSDGCRFESPLSALALR